MAFLTEAAIGPYQLTALLGQGGMSDVYRAVDTRTGAPVALKVVRSPDVEMASRMALEVRALERFSHPALVRLLDSGVASGQAYMVMELVEGQTLGQRLSDGPLSPAETAHLGRRLASALAYVHGQGIVHRDVKPGNVLLSRAGDSYLADFGIARLLDASTMTMTGTTLGTAAYMAPEQLQDHQVGPEADIWSLGAVLYECLSGHRLFEGSPHEVLARRITGRVPVPSGLPPAWQELIGAMLDSRPAARPSGPAVVEALHSPAFSGPWWPAPGQVDAAATEAVTVPPRAPRPLSTSVTAVDVASASPGTGPAPTRRPTSRLPAGAGATGPLRSAGGRARAGSRRSRRAPALAAVLATALAGGILVAAWPASPATRGLAGAAAARAGAGAAAKQGRARTSVTHHGVVPTTGQASAKPGDSTPRTGTPPTSARRPSSTAATSSSSAGGPHGATPAASSSHEPVASALSSLVGTVEAAATRGKLDFRLGAALVSLAEDAVYASAHGDSPKATADLQEAQGAISQAAGSKLIEQGTAAALSRAVSALAGALGAGSGGSTGTPGGGFGLAASPGSTPGSQGGPGVAGGPAGPGGPPGHAGPGGGPPGHDGGPHGHGDGGPQGAQGH